MVSFYDPTALMVQFNIPAPILPVINVGQKVMINGKTYNLTHVQKMLDETTHMAPASVDIVSEGYIVGVPIDVDLTVHEKNNVIVLSDDAVF